MQAGETKSLASMLSSLNTKVFVATVAMLTIMVVFSDAILNLVVVPRFEESDRAIALLNVIRIKSAMAGEVTELDGLVDDWAFWDDTYAFVAGSRPDYVTDNLYLKAMSGIRVNAFHFYREDGTLIHSVGFDLATGAPIDIPELASVVSLGAVPENVAPDAEPSHGGLILTARGPAFVAVAPILTSRREGPPRGMVIIARLFGPAQITEMQQRTGTAFSVWTANTALPADVAPIGAGLSAHPEDPVFKAAGGRLTTYFSLPDVNGAPALIVATETEMVGSTLGRRAVFLAELCLVAVGLVNLVLFFFQIRYLVLKPLTRMEQHIVRVGATGELAPYPEEDRRDQFGRVGREFNEMMRALAQLRAAAAERSTQYQATAEALAQSVETLRQLGLVGQTIAANLDADAVFDATHAHITSLLAAPRISIYLFNEERTRLVRCFGREGNEELPTLAVRLDDETSVAARAVRERREILEDAGSHEGAAPAVAGESAMASGLYVPLIAADRVLGVLVVESDLPRAYGEREQLICRTLVAYGAIAFANVESLTALHRAQVQLKQMAYHDPLTNLANRRMFAEDFRMLLAVARRQESELALLLIDLDRFKEINDEHGHDAGDAVLVAAAARMQSAIRQTDRASRLGGDEFAILLLDGDGTYGVDVVCRRILQSFAEPIAFRETMLVISPSIGASIFPRHGASQDDLYKAADIALYEAKRAGRNTWRLYEDSLSGEPAHSTSAATDIES